MADLNKLKELAKKALGKADIPAVISFQSKASPATILTMLSHIEALSAHNTMLAEVRKRQDGTIEALQARVRELSDADDAWRTVAILQNRISILEHQLEAAQGAQGAQEPYGWHVKVKGGEWHFTKDKITSFDIDAIESTVTLYAEPVRPAPVLSDADDVFSYTTRQVNSSLRPAFDLLASVTPDANARDAETSGVNISVCQNCGSVEVFFGRCSKCGQAEYPNIDAALKENA